MGWWSEPVGGKKAAPKSKPTKGSTPRGKVVASTKTVPGKRKGCGICGKSSARCTCNQVGDAIPTRRGTPKGKADRIESSGVIWCGTCNSRVNPNNGTCMNVTCSTRR